MLNVTYAYLTRNAGSDDLAEFDRSLEIPFDWELSPFERQREEARRMAQKIGALSGQADGLAAMRTAR